MVTELIRWRVPKGSQGLMGWQLTSSGAQVIPATPGAFMVAVGESGVWQLAGLHNTGDWNVTGYNLGAYPHTIYLEFMVSPIGNPLTQADRIAAVAGLAMANLVPSAGR